LAGRRRILDVDVPRSYAVDGLVGGITSPQTLYQHRGSGYLAVEVLLPLFLLHF
jgi:hypothetical protein